MNYLTGNKELERRLTCLAPM